MTKSWLQRLGDAVGAQTQPFELLSGAAMARTLAVVAIGGIGFAAFSLLHQEPAAKQAGIGIIHPWSRGAGLKGEQYQVYATFENSTARIDRLIAVESPLAHNAVLKTLDARTGRVLPSEYEELAVPGNSKVSLRPGVNQITLIGLKQRVDPGAVIPLTFVFSRAGRLTADVRVENLGQPEHEDHS